MRRSFVVLCALLLGSALGVGCGSEAPASTPEPAAEPAAAPAPAPVVVEPVAAGPADSPVENHFPTALAPDVTAPGSRVVAFPDTGYFRVVLPEGIEFAVDRGPRIIFAGAEGFAAGTWYNLSGTAAPVAIYTHNPAGDDGAQCPTLDEVRTRLAGAELTVREVELADDSGLAQVVVFTRGEAAGFYVHREFDHGDDATDYCAAFGTKDEPFAFTTTATPEEARRIAGALVSAHEDFE